MNDPLSVVCIGAGPAGLTAGYVLGRGGIRVTVLEQDPHYVGGISRTETYKGFAFDIGGHRFFSKSDEIEALWDEILDEGFLERPRKSRIYYKRALFDYPLRAADALSKLGVVEAARCVASYLRARLRPNPSPRNFEEWVTNQFGRRLFEIFFRTYTEKVWGMACRDISADWAAQRIKGLSLGKAIWHALRPQSSRRPRGQVIKTLIDRFRYPRRGPGMLWEAAARKVEAMGGQVLMGRRVCALKRLDGGRWRVTACDQQGRTHDFVCDHVISSMPMRDLAPIVTPPLPPAVLAAARELRYRDFLVVALILKNEGLFDDNWIYIHDPDVQVGRIQNFKSWSPDMVPLPGHACYGLEYFCFEHDSLWRMPDADLVALATDELVRLGLARPEDILDGAVVRQPKAYPIYDDGYQARVAAIRTALDAACPGLHLVGRNGMHRYNNQDHAMMTAILVARNILAGQALYDAWKVNQDAEYHEETRQPPDQPAAAPELALAG
ncbi:NAD(P)/FAD-dependent oxidoreductase [Nguyenibacter vanlangensis]|uniref:NAD(P)/FAD-dependent oxidoreductase n=1 Tax=Nguyenibacter vanlangensis TaxID=1216886 RepID=A0A7Y7M6L0_9PROT|nr:NAD(P)/FAD-dependent oxidoreductase [Nguyenibacter vanlangensis]NVN11064.1 NAD(P)/FAD-dependent oxidoreductase [Nguyenibacter vanlangensis]